MYMKRICTLFCCDKNSRKQQLRQIGDCAPLLGEVGSVWPETSGNTDDSPVSTS